MNFGQIQTLISSWLDDPNQTYFTPSQLQQWANNGQLKLNLKLIQANESWYTKTVQTTLIANQQCYLLPSDAERISHMELILGGVYPNEQKFILTHSTPGESDIVNYSPSQPVTFFTEGQNCLVFTPPPDKAYLVRMKYCRIVSDMVLGSEAPDAPRQYHEYVALLGAEDGFSKDRRPPDGFDNKVKLFEDLIRQSANNRMTDKPREVVQTFDDGFGTLF